jgi:hypothetical protein
MRNVFYKTGARPLLENADGRSMLPFFEFFVFLTRAAHL